MKKNQLALHRQWPWRLELCAWDADYAETEEKGERDGAVLKPWPSLFQSQSCHLKTKAMMAKPMSNLHSEEESPVLSTTKLNVLNQPRWKSRQDKGPRLSIVFSLHLMTTAFLNNRKATNGRSANQHSWTHQASPDGCWVLLSPKR